ncbi:hypothetical protein ACIHCQ_05135 [Streptomyces sp. NPDC052236]
MKALCHEPLTRSRELRAVGLPELVDSGFDSRVRALPFAFASRNQRD